MRAATALALLAACAGGIDLLSIMVLGGVFSGIITGNLVHLGQGLGAGHLLGTTTAIMAVAAFGTGVWLWARLLGPTATVSHRRSTTLLATHTALFALFTLVWALVGGTPPGHKSALALLMVSAFAMGAQSAWARVSGVSTTYLTGALTTALAGWAQGDRLGAHSGAIARLMALTTGALVTMILLNAWPWSAPLLPLTCSVGALALWWSSPSTQPNTSG